MPDDADPTMLPDLVGADARQGRHQSDWRPNGPQRVALIALGVALAALFVGFAIAQGIGSPGVPSGDVALVEGVPEEVGHVSKKEFAHALEQQLAQAKLKKAPKAGSDKYEELKKAALGELLDQIWIQGEAEELGVEVTDKEVEDELANIKRQSFSAPGSFGKFLKESHFTQEDVDIKVRLQVLSGKVQETINEQAPAPSESEVESYYEKEKAAQFTAKESRDVRIVVNKDKGEVEAAKEALEKDNSPASWKKVAAKYSSDPTSKSKGGLQEGISEELLQGPVKAAIFDSAIGELAGPVKFQTNWILVEVVKLNRAEVKPLDEVKAQIEETLKGEKQQEFFSGFVADFQSKWASRTQCASGYVIDRCENYAGSGHPSNAPAACYEADPKTPATECPAVVMPTSPALPGSVTPLEPKGKPMAQRPHPAGDEEASEEAAAVPAPVE